MAEPTFESLGWAVAGEIPEPWVHDYDDWEGDPIDFSAGYTAKLTYRVDGGTQVVRDATLVDAGAGKVGLVWVAEDHAVAGLMAGELTVGDGGTYRPTRTFERVILPPRGGPLPAI